MGIHTTVAPNSLGFVYLPAFLSISFAALFAAPWGVKLIHRCSTLIVRKIFGIVLLLVGLFVIAKAASAT